MKQIVNLLVVCTVALFISGCWCDKTVQCDKPKIPEVKEANITQCNYLINKGQITVEFAKCDLVNYFNMKKERDTLREVLNNLK